MLNPFDLDTIGSGVDKLVKGVGYATQPIRNGLGGIMSSFGTNKATAQTGTIPRIPVGENYQNHMQQVNNAINGSFKKGGPVPKTGIYKMHKGEFVLNKKQVDSLKDRGNGSVLKGYKETFKTNTNKKYSRDKSIDYRKRYGYFKTKIDGGGHSAGYKWATKEGVDPKDRKRKYGANSPSFDEGVYEFKQRAKQNALKNKMK